MAGEDVTELEGRHRRRQVDPRHSQERDLSELRPVDEEKPCPISLDQSWKEEQKEGEEDHDRFFEPVQRLRTIREELWKGVGGYAAKSRALPGVVGAVAAQSPHLDRPEKCDPSQ